MILVLTGVCSEVHGESGMCYSSSMFFSPVLRHLSSRSHLSGSISLLCPRTAVHTVAVKVNTANLSKYLFSQAGSLLDSSVYQEIETESFSRSFSASLLGRFSPSQFQPWCAHFCHYGISFSFSFSLFSSLSTKPRVDSLRDPYSHLSSGQARSS